MSLDNSEAKRSFGENKRTKRSPQALASQAINIADRRRELKFVAAPLTIMPPRDCEPLKDKQNMPQSDSLSVEEMQQKIAANLGIAGLPHKKQKEMIDKATEILLKKIFLENVERLSEEDKNSYLELIEKEAAPEEVEKFLSEKITGYSGVVQKLVEDFVNEMKASAT